MSQISRVRLWKNRLMMGLCYLALGIALVPLLSIIFVTAQKALPTLNLEFLTALPAAYGTAGGGIGNAIQGTAILVFMASLIGIPVGVLTGIYLSEYGRGRAADVIRFFDEVLSGFPSIVIGVFVWSLIVVNIHHFAAFAGSVALSILMIPVVARTTEESLKLVPNSIREASLALGIPKWRTTLSVVLSVGRSGVITGAILAVSRIAGETAPILLTTLSSSYWFAGLNAPVSSLPLTIYYYAISPFADMRQKAWGAAFLLIMFVLGISIIVRLISRKRYLQ
jgi:phosphate transport system permease protein